MVETRQLRLAPGIAAVALALGLASSAQAQSSGDVVYHQVEGRLHAREGSTRNIRVRLVRVDQMRPIGDTFSRPEGQFVFTQVPEGDYAIETYETETFATSSTPLSVHPLPKERPAVLTVLIYLSLKPPPDNHLSGVIRADTDLHVPKAASKHFQAGMHALATGKNSTAIAELRSAIEIYPEYYAARLELGLELRRQKQIQQAEEVLRPLREIAPRLPDPWIQHGIVLLGLRHEKDAAADLGTALQLDEKNWEAHFYFGWALLERNPDEAEPHFRRALELNEQKAARAYLALARLANSKGQPQLALQHLDAYLALEPDSEDAKMARQLAERLRKSSQADKKLP